MYPHWRSMVTKQFIAPIQGSAAAADPLEGQVPLVVHMISDGRICGPWRSKLWSLEVFRAVDLLKRFSRKMRSNVLSK